MSWFVLLVHEMLFRALGNYCVHEQVSFNKIIEYVGSRIAG